MTQAVSRELVRVRDGRCTWLLDVSCRISRGMKPVTTGPPDNWSPGDGPEIEILAVAVLHGTCRVGERDSQIAEVQLAWTESMSRPLGELLAATLEDDIRDAILEKLT